MKRPQTRISHALDMGVPMLNRHSCGLGAWAGLALQQGQGYRQRTAQLGMSYKW